MMKMGSRRIFFSSFFIYFTNDYLQINMVGLFSPTASHHLSTANYATSATVSYKTINEQEKTHTYGPRDIASLSLGPSFCVLPTSLHSRGRVGLPTPRHPTFARCRPLSTRCYSRHGYSAHL